MAKRNEKIRIKIESADLLRRIRKPMPPPAKVHPPKKGKRSYNRRYEKKRFREMLEEYEMEMRRDEKEKDRHFYRSR